MDNIWKLDRLLTAAEKAGCAVGSFSLRLTPMIQPILLAGQQTQSPLLVQISSREMARYGDTPPEVAEEFYKQVRDLNISVPVGLHLDHTKDLDGIKVAIEAKFTSVMIDASEHPLDENIRITREVVEYAHAHNVAVEAELGRIGTTDYVETEKDEELYTVPEEAKRFVDETGVDALAVSVGTAHGVYNVRQPKVDDERLKAIRALTPVHLVLHGGSGVPAGDGRQLDSGRHQQSQFRHRPGNRAAGGAWSRGTAEQRRVQSPAARSACYRARGGRSDRHRQDQPLRSQRGQSSAEFLKG